MSNDHNLLALGVLPHGAGTAPDVDAVGHASLEGSDAEDFLSQGVAVGLIAAGGGVADVLNEQSVVDQQSGSLTGDGAVQVHVLQAIQDAGLSSDLSDLDSPVGAGELAGLVVADDAQQGGQGLITSQGGVGSIGAVAHALQVASVSSVANIASIPGVSGGVGEACSCAACKVIGVDVGDVAGSDAIGDGGQLCAGQVTLGSVGVVANAFQDAQLSCYVNSSGVLGRDACAVLVVTQAGSTGGDHQGHCHDQGQNQCQNLLQVSHRGLPPFKFFEPLLVCHPGTHTVACRSSICVGRRSGVVLALLYETFFHL